MTFSSYFEPWPVLGIILMEDADGLQSVFKVSDCVRFLNVSECCLAWGADLSLVLKCHDCLIATQGLLYEHVQSAKSVTNGGQTTNYD